MNVKIDTKEKFTVITPNFVNLPANMTAELSELLLGYFEKDIPHVVLKMNEVKEADPEALEAVADMQQKFYESDKSFVVCELQEPLKKILADKDLLDVMNITPSESEAWDIVQMEEVERELMKGEWD